MAAHGCAANSQVLGRDAEMRKIFLSSINLLFALLATTVHSADVYTARDYFFDDAVDLSGDEFPGGLNPDSQAEQIPPPELPDSLNFAAPLNPKTEDFFGDPLGEIEQVPIVFENTAEDGSDPDAEYEATLARIRCELAYLDQPNYFAGVDYVVAAREGPGSRTLFQNGGGAILDARELDSGYEDGYRMFARYLNDDGNGFEIAYIGLQGWVADRRPGVPGNLVVSDQNVVATNNASFFLQSELHSFEVNAVQRNGWWHGIMGFRYSQWSEDYLVTGPVFEQSNVDNFMFGGVFGLEANLLKRNCWSIDGRFKTGVYFNSASGSHVVRSAGFVGNAQSRQSHLAWTGELGLSVSRQLSENVAISLGYEAAWLEGVESATGQIGSTNFANGTISGDAQGVFFHGAVVGVRAQF